jgi:hypothetical protein
MISNVDNDAAGLAGRKTPILSLGTFVQIRVFVGLHSQWSLRRELFLKIEDPQNRLDIGA